MKRFIIGALLALISLSTLATTTVPSSLINWVTAPSAPSQAATYVFAAPNASAGVPTFRQLIASDISGLGTSATVNTGTSGATIPLLNGVNTWASAQTFTVRPTFNGATPWDSANLSFAAPPSIGGTTPAAGAFTTLKASQTAKVFAQNSSAQSIPNNTATTVTGWTSVFDQNSNFTASTGTFTAPVTGYYWVSAQVAFNGTMAVATLLQLDVISNGSNVAAGSNIVGNATPTTNTVSVSALVSLTSGQTIQVKAVQNSGGAIPLNSGGTVNYLSISQVP